MLRIIVVDDDASTTNLIKIMLEMDGYSVATFSDVQPALAEANSGVSAFIIDYYLGSKTSGLDMLRSLRTHESGTLKETPVIMVSGDERVEQEANEAGADIFMLKPYSPNELSRIIRKLIDARQAQAS